MYFVCTWRSDTHNHSSTHLLVKNHYKIYTIVNINERDKKNHRNSINKTKSNQQTGKQLRIINE